MKWVLGLGFIAILVLMTACDPGMAIRQIKSPGALNGSVTSNAQVNVHIETKHQLIGETLYGPEVKVTNATGSPIAVTNVELTARSKTYANTHPRPETYPLTIQPGSAETLHVLFRLDDSVHKTFQQSAELLVH